MKNNFIKALSATALVFTLLLCVCCHHDKNQLVTTPGLVGFHFHTYIYDTVVDPVEFPYQWFPDANGRLENLSVAQFYVTNITIHTVTGNWYPISNDVILKRINNEVYPLADIPLAPATDLNYIDSVKFTVGLGNALNSQPPTSFSTTSPLDSVLSTNEQALMWGSGTSGMVGGTSGYTFMYIQGRDSTDHLNFNYQIGGYGDTVNVVLTVPGGFNFNPVNTNGNYNLIHIVADYGQLLQVIAPMTSGNTSSTFYGSTPTPSVTLLNAIKNMFRWECTPPINC